MLFLLRYVLTYPLSKMLVNLVKYRGIVRVFNNCKFFNSLQCKKMVELTFLWMYFFIEYCYLLCNIVVLLFILLTALVYLKPKVHNVAAISAFGLFCNMCIHLRTANWLYSPFLILLSCDVVSNPGARYNYGESFQSATGTLIVCLLTITQSYLL